MLMHTSVRAWSREKLENQSYIDKEKKTPSYIDKEKKMTPDSCAHEIPEAHAPAGVTKPVSLG